MKVTIGDTELFYETIGTGRLLITLHGGMGLDHSCFRPWLDPLAAHAAIVYVDQRGHGRSSRPATYDGIDVGTWARDMDALRAHLGYDKVVLLGHSAGGFIAQVYALRYGDHLAGLILDSTAPVIDYGEVIQRNAAARGTPAQLQAVAATFGGAPFATDDEFHWN